MKRCSRVVTAYPELPWASPSLLVVPVPPRESLTCSAGNLLGACTRDAWCVQPVPQAVTPPSQMPGAATCGIVRMISMSAVHLWTLCLPAPLELEF